MTLQEFGVGGVGGQPGETLGPLLLEGAVNSVQNPALRTKGFQSGMELIPLNLTESNEAGGLVRKI